MPPNAMSLQNYSDFNQGMLGEFILTGTITIAAANRKRLEVATTVHSTLAALVSAERGQQVKVNSYKEDSEFISSKPFSVTPMIVLLENGEVMTAQDSNSHYLNEVLEAALPSSQQCMYKVLGTKFSKMNSLGTYTTHTKVNLSKAVKRWVEDYYKKELAELTAGYLDFYVAYLFCGEASQSITRASRVTHSSCTEARSITKSYL